MAPVVLPENTDDPTVDAGYLASGALTVTKQLEGQGVVPFAGGDEFAFSVVCTLNGKEVLNNTYHKTHSTGESYERKKLQYHPLRFYGKRKKQCRKTSCRKAQYALHRQR